MQPDFDPGVIQDDSQIEAIEFGGKPPLPTIRIELAEREGKWMWATSIALDATRADGTLTSPTP